MYNKVFLLVLSLCLSFSIHAASKHPLDQSSWILSSLNNQAALAEAVVSLDFDNGKTVGTDGCNRYRTSYTVKGKKLSINKNIASTMMMCPDAFMQQASAYTKALLATTGFKLEDQQLSLLDKKGRVLAVFTKQREGLAETEWKVNNINNGRQAVVGLLTGSTITMRFGADGKVNGSAGCNDYDGSYSVTAKAIKITDIGVTKKACTEPVGVMEQEAQFLNALKTVATFQREGNLVGLRTAEDALAMMLMPK